MHARVVGWFGCGLFALPGSAPLAEAPPEELPETKILRGARQCIRIDRIREYQFMDDHNLVVFAPNRRRMYHVELHPSCLEANNAFGIQFYDPGARRLKTFCSGSGYVVQHVLGREQDDSFAGERCHVRSIRPLNDEQLYELSIDKGRVAPPPPLPRPELEVGLAAESAASEAPAGREVGDPMAGSQDE